MNQIVIEVFKVYYFRRTFAQAIAKTKEDTEETLLQFWEDFTSMTASRTLLRLGVLSPRFV